MGLSSPWKLWFQEVVFQTWTPFSLGNTALMIQLLTQMVFFWEIHVFLPLSWVALSGETSVFPPW
jgi:hypothetical protein